MKQKRIVGAAILAVCLWVFFGQDSFVRLAFRDISMGTVMEVLTPLFLAALFIERAVEVYTGVSREPEKLRLKAQAEARKGEEKKEAAESVAAFRRDTLRKTSTLSFLLGLAAAAAGVRSLWPLLDPTVLVPEALQFRVFNLVDVVVTAGLLAGGSAGIHKMIGPIDDWLQAKRK